LKHFDDASSLEVMSPNGTVYPTASGPLTIGSMVLVPPGPGEEEMIGSKITIKSIEIRGRVLKERSHSATLAANENVGQCRIVVVQDRQCNGAVATANMVYENSANSVGSAGILDFGRISNSKRFRILKEWYLDFNAVAFQDNCQALSTTDTSYASGRLTRKLHWYKKCNIVCDFERPPAGFARTIGDVKSNNIFVIGFGLTTLGYLMQFHWRIRYEDC